MAGIYVHVPFRSAPRRYDDAYAVPIDEADVPRYVDAVCAEIQAYGRTMDALSVDTLYVGGGRPSLLSTDDLFRIVTSLWTGFDRSVLREVTVEAHPLDLTPSFLDGVRDVGGTRLSVECMGLDPDTLRAASVPHTMDDVTRALHHLQGADLDSFSVDIVLGAPGQTRDALAASLRRAVDRAVPHVTLVEWPGSDSASAQAGETTADAFLHATDVLETAGYDAYEITHFAQPGHASVHERNLLGHGNLLGFGPSAHSFWWPFPRSSPETARRWHNVAHVDPYAARVENGECALDGDVETPGARALAREYVFLRLRTDEGLRLARLAHRYGVDLVTEAADRLSRLSGEGLIEWTDERVGLTRRGRLHADAMVPYLLPPS